MVSGIALIVVGILLFVLIAKAETDSLQFAIIFGAALGCWLYGLNALANATFLATDASDNTTYHSVTHETSTPNNSNHPTYTPTRKPVN